MTGLKCNNNLFEIINGYDFGFSNNEVTFSDITIDFTGYTLADIPFKYQEVQIIKEDKVIFTGYVDEISLSDMKEKQEDREMTLTLLSPLKMATKRNVSLIGTYKVKDAIVKIINPLIDDGFVLKEMFIDDGQITTNYILETVENCMNDIGFKRNIFWYINELKEIFIYSIDYLFGLVPVKTMTEDKIEKGLFEIKPTIESIDYANVINIKNVRLIYSESDSVSNSLSFNVYPIMQLPRTIKKGDCITFDNPIIIDEDTLKEIREENQEDQAIGISITITKPNSTTESYSIVYKDENLNGEFRLVTTGDITFSDDDGEEGTVVLQRDVFFKNLITGFKWNGDTADITSISSNSALRYTIMRFMYSPEINYLKGIISDSGIIEKTIDYKEKWTTLDQLTIYARSLMKQNSNVVNQVVLKWDINPNLKVGDIVDIQYPSFYVSGKFAVKEINYTYNNDLDEEWEVILKTSDLISSYIDMFRPKETEEAEERINSIILSEFIEEGIREIHYLEINNKEHTLDFNL